MACAHGQHAHLQQLEDPTHTQTIRENFLKALRERFRRLRGMIRRVAGYEQDRFNLKQDAALQDPSDIERFPSDDGKIKAFVEWLRERLQNDILEVAGQREIRDGEHWSATYIRAAYSRGWENAVDRLEQSGVDVDRRDLERVFRMGVPQRQLRDLYTRTYENLQSVTEDAVPAVRETLTQGLAEGVNPRVMARRLSKEVRTVQHTQAEVLARTEVINSYSEATLTRYERASVDGVTVSGEFATADDSRVCPICEAIEGMEYAVDEMREASFTFEPSESDPDYLGGEYPVRPPVHPQCRCAILPVIE